MYHVVNYTDCCVPIAILPAGHTVLGPVAPARSQRSLDRPSGPTNTWSYTGIGRRYSRVQRWRVAITKKIARLTRHAVERCAQRAVRPHALSFALEHGRLYRGPDSLVVFFGKHEVERYRYLGSWVERLHGLVIVLDSDGQSILTVYKNRGGLRRAGRKRDALL